jgi:hypothetical protein
MNLKINKFTSGKKASWKKLEKELCTVAVAAIVLDLILCGALNVKEATAVILSAKEATVLMFVLCADRMMELQFLMQLHSYVILQRSNTLKLEYLFLDGMTTCRM